MLQESLFMFVFPHIMCPMYLVFSRDFIPLTVSEIKPEITPIACALSVPLDLATIHGIYDEFNHTH
jgi:hypothetical protein